MNLDEKIQLLLDDAKPSTSTPQPASSSSSLAFNPKLFGIAYGLSLVASCAITFLLRPQFILSFSALPPSSKPSDEESDETKAEDRIEVQTSIVWKNFLIFAFILSILILYPI